MVAISHAHIAAVVIALDLIIIISKQVTAVGYTVKAWAKRLGVMVGAVWLANVAKNSALVTSFVTLTGATVASTKASVANAFSVQGQITAYNALSTPKPPSQPPPFMLVHLLGWQAVLAEPRLPPKWQRLQA